MDTNDEEFFDCDDEEVYGSPLSDSFADALSTNLTLHNRDNDEQPSHTHGRTHLPVPMFSRSDFSIWSILKQCIGRELSKITMPVIFNEPLSFIQRISEYMEYSYLLDKAVDTDDPVLRLQYVAAFAVSAISSNWERVGKPFNPLLGETYELDRMSDLGFRLVGEQVSHHPPITAFHAEGKGYTFHGSIHPKLKFWGKTVEIVPKGIITLHLKPHNEVYTWQNVNCCMHNVIVGKLWVEHYGTMEIVNHALNMKAVLNFKQCGWFGKDLHHVEGFIYDSKKVKQRAIYGSWVLGLYACDVDTYEDWQRNSQDNHKSSRKGSANDKSTQDTLTARSQQSYNADLPGQETLFTSHARPSYSPEYYHFTLFAMALNELRPGMAHKLPPTDSRLRPDIRCMEDGRIDEAAEEKNRLEEKQRDKRKERKKKKDEWTPVWFRLDTHPQTSKEDWFFNKDYWSKRWDKSPDIF